ncbi:MAG: transporter substrate-binding domain-containing protein [Paraglaciecola sp.]|uniref:substrate-binding periplasmic protein n=1 Tax=Pseudomonadati TaxID=3379134 RepID=UPI00273DD774|nr:transporter substrate-binding domain-containing protein [Paraglaciecola sp.]MDP5029927.1 transporter substrate-binding domain-containing protein [Paraglaciecola sp.]MDP5130743.1 transporter substrate-binding domain-containing protein [Paraglaciecola sp.]
MVPWADFKFKESLLILGYLVVGLSFHSQAKELVLVAGWEKPPYVIASENAGFEIELMRQVLAKLEHSITVLYVPYGRTYETFLHENADIGLTLTVKAGVPPNSLSQPYVVYQNVAISLKNANIKFDKLSDLKALSVIAFQNASKILGSSFANAVESNLLYIELPDQRRQVEMLLIGSVDVVVMDINIFNYFSQAIRGSSQMENVNVQSFFPTTRYSAAFKDAALMAEFDTAFTQFSVSEAYQQLVQKYQLVYPDLIQANH